MIVAICIDGFDPEYLEACDMPNIKEIVKKGFLTIGECMMPSVTNVNNVSIVTASYPEEHGICSNYWLRDRVDGIYMESREYITKDTIFELCRNIGKVSVIATSKDKLRTLLDTGAAASSSSEKPSSWIIDALGAPPPIYSIEINGWTFKAASHMIDKLLYVKKHRIEVVYITTTDYAMHTFGPDHPKSQEHMTILDNAIGELVDAHPEMTLLITADHGMSDKRRMIHLPDELGRYGIKAQAIPIIKDRHVVHHSNLGGCIYVYLDKKSRKNVNDALAILQDMDGVEEALCRKEAARKYHLMAERIGDIMVNGVSDVVFGDPSEVNMPDNLRSHGSLHERKIPIIGYNGDFDGFEFKENRDVGRYITEHCLV